LLKADFTCHTEAVIGGVALKLALVEKENKPESYKALISNVVSPSFSSSVQADSPAHTLFVAEDLPPPSVDRYVLNGSFLI